MVSLLKTEHLELHPFGNYFEIVVQIYELTMSEFLRNEILHFEAAVHIPNCQKFYSLIFVCEMMVNRFR